MSQIRTERMLGCFLGLAVGDAVGVSLEFKERGTFEPIEDMVGGGPFNLEAGEGTDDTSMSICLARSLIERGKFDLRDQIEKYVEWYHGDHVYPIGGPDIGLTTLEAIKKYEQFGEARSGSDDEFSAGNGCIMRLAPVPIFFAHDLSSAIRYSEESARSTHQERRCLDACRYLGALIWGALNGKSKEELLRPEFPQSQFWSERPLHPEVADIARGDFKEPELPESTGFVIHTLKAALWAFYHSRNFREGTLMAANLGGDSDTIAAVHGQLAGAYYGRAGIPAEWLQKLKRREQIESLTLALAGQVRRDNVRRPEEFGMSFS